MNLQKRLEQKRRDAAARQQRAAKTPPATEEGGAPPSPVSAPPSTVLGALMVDNNKDTDALIIKVSDLVIRPQIRKHFDPDALEQLADDIQAHGQDTPVIVRRLDDGQWELVAGERRVRAKEVLQQREPGNVHHRMIRATVRVYDEKMKHLRQLAENIQREQLTPLEEAEALAKVKEEDHLTDAALGELVKKSRSFVTRRLELLTLSPALQYLVNRNEVGARTALSQKDQALDAVVAGLPDGLKARIELGEMTTLEALEARATWQEPDRDGGGTPTESSEPVREAAVSQGEKTRRQVTVSISLEAGEALCELLSCLARDLELNAINVKKQNRKTVRKELIAALNGRAKDVLSAYKKS